MTSRLSPAFALACALPAAALAAPSDAELAAMQRRMQAMEARMAQMQALIDQLQQQRAAPVAAAAPAASAGGWGDAPPASRDEVDALRQKVARQGMKLDRLFTDAYDSPGAGLQVTGYLDPTYVVNYGQRAASFQFLNGGDRYTYDDSSTGDVFLHISKTFGTGALAPKADLEIAPTRGYGMANTNSSGAVVPTIVHVALATVPLDAQWSATAGRAAGFAGYEYYESTLMNTLTHNLLYDFSEAGNMSGIGFNWTNARQDWAWKFFLSNEEYYANGSRGGALPNRVPTVAARFDYTASTALYYGGSMMIGRDTLYATDDGCASGYGYQCTSASAYGSKFSMDLDMSYLGADLSYNAQVDFGEWVHGAWNGGTARWWGASALVHRRWTSPVVGRWGATLRADYLNDAHNGGGSPSLYLGGADAPGTDAQNGFGISPACLAAHADSGAGLDLGQSCSGSSRWALTGTLLLMPSDQWTLKAELRYDRASHAVFGTPSGQWRRGNEVFGLQSVYAF